MKKVLLALLFFPILTFAQEKDKNVATDSKSSRVSWTVKADIKEGQLERLDKLIMRMKSYVKEKESGVIHYDFFISEGKDKLFIYEEYENNEHVVTHIENFKRLFAESFATVVENGDINVFGRVSQEVRVFFDELNTTYWKGHRR